VVEWFELSSLLAQETMDERLGFDDNALRRTQRCLIDQVSQLPWEASVGFVERHFQKVLYWKGRDI
jgi:hypothetical protein